jgi:hypothetical protein
MSSAIANQVFPEVIGELFRPFDIQEPLDGPELKHYKTPFRCAFDELAGKGKDDLEQRHEVDGISIKLQRKCSKEYDFNSFSGRRHDPTYLKGRDTTRSVTIKGLVAVTDLRLEVEAFMAVSFIDVFLQGARNTTEAEYGFKLSGEVANALFGKSEEKFTTNLRHSTEAALATRQAFGLTIEALRSLRA